MSEHDDLYHLGELATRQASAEAMGGEDKIARQHDKGRLTARERFLRRLASRPRMP